MAARHPMTIQHHWPLFALKLAILVGLVFGIHALALPEGLYPYPLDFLMAFLFGMAIVCLYPCLAAQVLARHLMRGNRLLQKGKYEEAIGQFEKAYAFFTKYEWLDLYRGLFMLSVSAQSHREMALNNIAFCYGQMGQGERMKACYEQLRREYPHNICAATTLKMIEAVEQSMQPAPGAGA